MDGLRHDTVVEDRGAERRERVVAGEKLISTIARERHCDVPASEPSQQVGRKDRRIPKRFVEAAQHGSGQLSRFRQFQSLLVMTRPEMVRGVSGIPRLVERRLGKADGERRDCLRRHQLRRRSEDRAGIHPAREKYAERDVADQTASDRLQDQGSKFLGKTIVVSFNQALIRLEHEAPVSVDGQLARFQVVEEKASAGKLARADVQRIGRREISVSEEFLKRPRVRRPADARMQSESVQLACKTEEPGRLRPIQRLFAEAVPGEQKPPCRRVEDREREHAVQPSRQIEPPFLVPMNEDLGVGWSVLKRWPSASSSARSSTWL